MDSLVVHVKSEDIYVDVPANVEKIFDTWSYGVERPLTFRKNKKNIKLMKDELDGKIMKETVILRPNMYSYITDDEGDNWEIKAMRKKWEIESCLISMD